MHYVITCVCPDLDAPLVQCNYMVIVLPFFHLPASGKEAESARADSWIKV